MPSAIRFAPVKCSQTNEITRPNSTTCPEAVSARARVKSRSGCRECKTSRVKCDETFPVCTRCQRLGRICRLVPRKDRQEQWQIEVPGITISGSFAPWHKNVGLFSTSHINKKLLWAWLKTTSRIMVLDNASNPLSFPILDYLSASASLVHVLQSISAGHDQFFEQNKLELSLQERSMAIKALQRELGTGKASMLCCFLTAYLLGTSSTFLDKDVLDYGKEHLFAARHMLEALIADPTSHQHRMTNFCLGAFIYWDMTCSVLIDPNDQKVIDDGVICEYLSNIARGQHPITGPCTEMFLLLGHLGRYCRAVLDTGVSSEALEQYFEQQLLQWDVAECEDFWRITTEAYRNHGLIMLYRTRASIFSVEEHLSSSEEEAVIRDLSSEVLYGLSKIPIDSPFLVLQATPLMSAGAELGIEDEEWRKEVVLRFKALFSSNRLPASLWAIALLQELWEFRDLGIAMSWLELMLAKNWRLRLG